MRPRRNGNDRRRCGELRSSFSPSSAWRFLGARLRGVFVVFVYDASVSGDLDGQCTRSQIARELARIVEPSEIDVLMVGDDFDQLDPVYRALQCSEVLDARMAMTCSAETARCALQLPTFDVVVVAGICGIDVLAANPELSVRSATLAIVDNPTAEVAAQALTSGAMAVLAVDEISTNLLQRTLQQILLRREAQNLLIDRLLSSTVMERTPVEQLSSAQLGAERPSSSRPMQEGMTATVQ